MPHDARFRAETPRLVFYLDGLAGGGVERITLNLLEGLTARGWRIGLWLNRVEGELLNEVPPAVQVVDLQAHSFLGIVRALRCELQLRQPGILVSQRAYLNLAAAIATSTSRSDCRLVFAEHSLLERWWADERIPKRTADHVVRHALPWVYRRADALVAVSRGIAHEQAHALGGWQPKIHQLPNPIVRPALAAMAADPVGGVPADAPWIVAVGRLEREKNHLALVEAFAAIARERAARLVLVGDGPQREALEARALALGVADRVHLIGFQPNPYAWIGRAAVLALPSLFETFPTVLVEAMALGTPVVSFDCPEGPREIVTSGLDGLLVPPESPSGLAMAIGSVLDDPELAARLRRGGPRRAADFTYARTMCGYENLFSELVGPAPTGARGLQEGRGTHVAQVRTSASVDPRTRSR